MSERRADNGTRDRLTELQEDYRKLADTNRRRHNHLARNTYLILGILVVIQLGLGILSVSLSSRAGKADANSRRIDRAVCAEVHYLERGLTLTKVDPAQSIVHNELKILIGNLRPLTHSCPPADPLVLPDTGPTPTPTP